MAAARGRQYVYQPRPDPSSPAGERGTGARRRYGCRFSRSGPTASRAFRGRGAPGAGGGAAAASAAATGGGAARAGRAFIPRTGGGAGGAAPDRRVARAAGIDAGPGAAGACGNEGRSMNCAWVQERLLLYQAGELGSEQRDAVARHLERCPRCAAMAEALIETGEQLETALPTAVEAPASLDARVMDAVRRLPPPRRSWRFAFPRAAL